MDDRRLVYASAADLDRWQCRPLGAIEIEDLKDRPVGQLDGILVDRRENRPMYLAVNGRGKSGQASGRFLVPVGDAWFDETDRAVRIDPARHRIPFDPDEFEQFRCPTWLRPEMGGG